MSFCRITGRSRGLPKPHYYPLLAPISPADAKRCCRITGKSYGLPSHHYIPVLLTSRSAANKCKITNVSGEMGPHHYMPEINYGNRKHDVLPGFRYIFPVLDGSTEAQKALMAMLLSKQVADDKKYVYTVQERRCSLVFSAQMEAAVRDGDVRDVMLAKDSDTVLIKMKQGRHVSMDFKDFTDDVEMYEGEGPHADVLVEREREELEEKKKKRKRAANMSSMKKLFETKEKLAEVAELEEEKVRQEKVSKKAKLVELKHSKHDTKTFTANNFDVSHMRSKQSIAMCNGDWKDQVHPIIESWDWETFEKDGPSDEHFIPKVTMLPNPVKMVPYHCESEIYEVDQNIGDASFALENVPCVNPLKTVKTRPSKIVLSAVKELTQDQLTETSDVTEKLSEENKIGMLPTLENISEVVKNIHKGKRAKVAKVSGLTLDINKAKKFIPGHHVNTPQGPVFVPGQTVLTPGGPIFVPGLSVNTPAGPSLLPGHIVTNENTSEPFFLAGQTMQTAQGEEFVCGQTIKNKDESYRFLEGQTVISEEGLKFVPGKVINNGPEEVFVPGQTIQTPEGVQFIPGQTITENNGLFFTPGQNAKINNEWQFVPGQVVHQDNELHFVPGATIATPNGLKFVPGQTVHVNGETCFVPGITKTSTDDSLEFVPGTTVDTIDGPKFIEGQIVQTEDGEKFMPGKTIVQANGHVEFNVAKSVDDITFSESTGMGLPIDIRTCTVSEESLYVFGHMIQTAKGIEFYPGPRAPKIEGKVVPGRLVKNEANESRFVPGMMVEGIFIPGQIVYTENGEQFVPGQVVDTKDGPKFVPGQVVNTKSGPKFVPGQTVHTIDGPRFVPGQIIETKAGPTFIPGQIIHTEEGGSRFVPGQVVDTEEGPRFVPGRVIETDDNGVTFVPGQIVQTPEGLKFVAPDLTEGEEGLEFSVQSFIVTPEELKLLKVKTNPNDTTSTNGELTIDTKMLRQLSEAGMSIGRQVPADLPAINVVLNETQNAEALKAFVSDFGLKDDVANQLMEVIKSIIEMSVHVKSEMQDSASNDTESNMSMNDSKKGRNGKKCLKSEKQNGFTEANERLSQQESIKNSIAAAVLAALVTAEQFEEVNSKNGKEKYQLILKSIDTILGRAINEDFVTAMYQVLQREDDKEMLCETILENSSQPKLELIKMAINSSMNKHSFTEVDIIEKFTNFLTTENNILGPAFKRVALSDKNLFRQILDHISDSISFIKTDNEATETLQKAIVTAVQEQSSKDLNIILQNIDNKDLKELIIQSVGLAKVLGMWDVADNLLKVVNDEEGLSKIASDPTSLNILQRLTVMRKLADKEPTLLAALKKLEKNTELARTDPNLRDLVRESAALMIIPEETPLMTSADVPLSLLDPSNSLAMEDFLFKHKRHYGALLIIKKDFQAVVPREASRAVLSGKIAYTVLDENGIRHFEPMDVFSALNLSQQRTHRYSMHSCPIADNDDNLENFNGYCNISNSQIITKLGGWNRRYSSVILERENHRNRIGSYDYTPSYRRYPTSRSSTRSRSSCSRSPSKVEDVVVASSDYTAVADDEVSLKAGDIVEVLDTKTAFGSKTPLDTGARDCTLDVTVELLDTSAAKHKRAVRPKKNHPRVKRIVCGDRWLVRVVEDVQGGEIKTRQGWVPARVLETVRSAEQDTTALAARRQAVVRELIETEEEFGRDMQQVVNRYMKPMDKATTPKPVFDNRELLFSNFKQIAEFHNTALLEGIKYYASEPKMLGRALLRMEREFDKHVAYCRDEPRAQHLLVNEPSVKKYFQEVADKLGDDKGLTEHLKLPIQRINDYQLLLKELVKYSKRIGEDCGDLQKALELFLGVPNRATDNKFIASIEGFRGNIYKLGRLLTHDWFTVTDSEGKTKERYIFLFKARILVCKVKRVSEDRSVFVLKDIIKLPEVEVKDNPEEKFKFSLIQKKSQQSITLTAHREPVKKTWLTEIRQHASDVVALAEHAADDLQVLSPPVTSPEPEDTKKRALEGEQDSQEKRTKLEQAKEETTAAKRKASTESAVATKVSRSEVTDAKTEVTLVSQAKTENSEVISKTTIKSAKAEVSEVKSEAKTKVATATDVKETKSEVSSAQVAKTDVGETKTEVAVKSAKADVAKSEVSASNASRTEVKEAKSDVAAAKVAKSEVGEISAETKVSITEVSEVRSEVASGLDTKSSATAKAAQSSQIIVEKEGSEVLQTERRTVTVEQSIRKSSIESLQQNTNLETSVSTKSVGKLSTEEAKSASVEKKGDKVTLVKKATLVQKSKTDQPSVENKSEVSSKVTTKTQETAQSVTESSSAAKTEVAKTEDSTISVGKLSAEEAKSASVEKKGDKVTLVKKATLVQKSKTDQPSVENKSEVSSQVTSKSQETAQSVTETSAAAKTEVAKTEDIVSKKTEESSVAEKTGQSAKSVSQNTKESSQTVEESTFAKTADKSVKAEESSKVVDVSVKTDANSSKTKSSVEAVTKDKTDESTAKSQVISSVEHKSSITTEAESKDSKDITSVQFEELQKKAADKSQVLTREESLLLLKASRKASLGKVTTTETKVKVQSKDTDISIVEYVQSLKNEAKTESSKTESSKTESSQADSHKTEEVVAKESEVNTSQAVTEGDDGDEMSRYSRTSRLSGEYSSSRAARSYETSGCDGSGLTSYSRRESGSRLDSSRLDSGALESPALSKYESKYSTSAQLEAGGKYGTESSIQSSYEGGAKRESITGSKYGSQSSYEGGAKRESITGSKYGTQSSYEGGAKRESITGSKYGTESSITSSYEGGAKRESITGSKYGTESNYESGSKRASIASKYGIETTETTSKLDSIASKYGIETSSEAASKIDSIASKYGIEANADTPSKIDSIASKYGISTESSYEASKTEGRRSSSKYGIGLDITLDAETSKTESIGRKTESSKIESSKQESSVETTYSKTSVANGAVEGYESTKSVLKSSTQDGKPIFRKTLEGQNIEPGENATFECSLQDASNTKVTWLKDNKPLTDRLMDRVNVVSKDDGYNTLLIQHCCEDDSGLYTARAENLKGNAHCTAQLVVTEMTAEERRIKNALNAPYFLVALKDTEILLNTYLRFMVKVKGNPNPDVKFYRDGKEIQSSESDRVTIVRTLADRGCYDLIIADVTKEDEGKYSCKASNIYGDVESEARVTVVDDKNIFFELAPGGEGLLPKGEKPSFSWKRDGEPFNPEERFKVLLGDDEDSLALVFQHVKPEDAGLYTCVAKTSTGNISCSAELTVQGAVHELHREPEKPKLIIEHKEAVVAAGASAMLELKCKGYPKPNVVFKHEGKVVEADARHKILYEDSETMSLVIKNVTSSDAGQYEVTASNDLGQDSTSINLVVKAPPRLKRKIENQSCMLNMTHYVVIEVEGAPTPEVSFYKDGVEIKSSERIQIVKESDEVYKIVIKDAKLSDSGSYSVVVKNEISQCSDFWQMQVSAPPKITKKLGKDRVCDEKEKVTFNIETEAEPEPTVKWFKNKEELVETSSVEISSTGKSHTLVISSAERSDTGEYSCEVRNTHGSASDSSKLSVRSGPKFTQRLRDLTAKEGDVNVEFVVAVEAYPEPTVKWYLGDMEVAEKKSVFTRIDNGNTHKLILKEVSAEYSGQYSCRVSNELGEDSCQATFTVNRKPRITKSLVDMTVEAGQTLTLDVEVEGCPEPNVKWFKDGKEVTLDARIRIERDTKRLENYHLTVTLVKEEDGGEYEVFAENEMGSVSSKSTVTVYTTEVHSRLEKEAIAEMEVEENIKSKREIMYEEEDNEKKQKADKGKTEAETPEEKSFWDDDEDSKKKKAVIDEVDTSQPSKARKSISEPEVAEEKSFWDDNEDGKPKKSTIDDADTPKPNKSRKSVSEPEVAEEKSFWDDDKDSKAKQADIKDADVPKPTKGRKSVSEPEVAEEKSFWDDDEDGKLKKTKVDDVGSKPNKGRKSITEPEVAEEKSFWDDDNDDQKSKKPKIEEVETPTTEQAEKSFTKAEEIEDKDFWDENHNQSKKQPIIEEFDDEVQTPKKGKTEPEIIEEVPIEVKLQTPKRKSVKKEEIVEEPLSAETEDRVFQTVTTFKSGANGSIIASKVSSTMSHGAIITGPAETRTLHKITSTYDAYEDDSGRKIIPPNEPHKTSLEVEEIASHSYFMTDFGHYTLPDHLRRGTYGVIEEPESEIDNSSRCSRQFSNMSNRAYSVSMSEDDTWQNESPSREISIEDLSKSIFDIDDSKKVFSKDSYVRQTSFIEDFLTDDGEEESHIIKEKSHKIYENDITERIINISKEFDEDEFKNIKTKIDDVRNRLFEEFILGPLNNIENITKNTKETTFEKKRRNYSKLYSVEEEADDDIEDLLKRSQRQRSILDDILTEEDEKAPPTIKDSNMKDSHIYESLPLMYSVRVHGAPTPVVKWLRNGKVVKPSSRVHITSDGDLHKLVIDAVEMDDQGTWACEITNDLGKKVQTAELSVTSVSEFRKPIFTTPLEAQQVMQKEPVTLKAVCTADPVPHVSWLLDGELLIPDATMVTNTEVNDIEHGLKECTFTLHIPTGRHADTGLYTIRAKNQYGVGESSARLDILLRPEIEGFKDITATPYEETTFIAKVRANPIAEVQWTKDGYVLQPSSQYDIVADAAAEKYSLTINKVGVGDAGVYKITAANDLGEASHQAKLTVHTSEPVFTKPLQKQVVKDYDDITLKVRCDGVPKPQVLWYRDGEEITDDDRHTVTTEVGGQVDSQLDIQHFNASDSGKYKVRAVNISGEAVCEAPITLAQTSPGFTHRLDRQRDVDEGEPLELRCKVDGSPMPTAKWYKDGEEISPDDPHVKITALPDGTLKLNIDCVTPNDCGAYKLVISNPNGDNSALCAVAVNPTPRKPTFIKDLEDTTAVIGQPLRLEAQVMAFPAPEIKWFKDGLPIRPSQAINFINQPGGIIGLSIDSCKPEDAGVYSLTVTNKLGDISSKANVDVTQKERKPAFIAELQPTKVIEGFPVKLEVKVLGYPQPTIKWTKDGKEIVPDGTHIKVVSLPDGTHALLIDKASPSDAGEYGVIAVNDKGETGCKADLTVASRADDSNPQERPRFIHGLRDFTAEEGQPLSVTAPFVGNPIPEVEWFKDGQPLKPSERVVLTCDGKRVGLEIAKAEMPDAGVYSVKLVNPLGEDSTEGNIAVRKVYSPPHFTHKFSDLQQLPTFDANFPARVNGLPCPEITWYKNGQPLRPSEKYNIKRDGDAVCLYVRNLTPEDAGVYKCVARNKEGEASCEANLEVVDKIGKRQKMEPPEFLKKIGDIEVLRGMSAKFTACATGTPEPDVEWYRNDERIFPCERIRIDKETTGLLRLTISPVDPTDVGTYKCKISNPHGEDACTAQLTYDTPDLQTSNKRPISDQYSDFDKMKKTGIPMPLADRPIISRMTDRHLTLSWKPSIPHGPRFPVTYQVEMCEMPDGDWFTARTGLRSCVCDIRNLEPFRDYKFRIRVENKYGVSDPSPFAITHRSKLEPDPPKFIPYLAPGIDFRPETSPYFPKDFDIERPPHDGYAQAPRFLRQEHDSQYGVKGHNVSLFWFVYGYPKPKMTYFFNDEPIEIGGRYDWSYTRNGQATLFINKMMDRDVGWYEAVATNEHGQARQRVRLEIAEYPTFIRRPEETVVLQRRQARMEARVTGVPYPEIKWYKDWQPIYPSARVKIQFIEPDTTVLLISDTIMKDEGLYSVSARNVAGAVSSSAMLHVEECERDYADRVRELPPRVKPSTKPFGDFYDLGDELGRGVQGVVYHAAERLTGRNYAAKIMHGHSELKPYMKNELDIMNMLNDRHLIRLHDAYEHDHTVALVSELASGGELVRDRLLRSQGYTEREIAGYVRQLLRGLKHMHDNSVAHLGLTIGEMLLAHAGSDELKLCDFGLSRKIQFNKHAALDYGMPEFVAPEVANGEGVTFAADMWSTGIITYILLSGHSPFRGSNDKETLTNIQNGDWKWHDEEWWSRLSTECRDFISKLLKKSWLDRMDVDTALNHPWLTLADKIYQDEYQISTDRLRNYYNLYRDWTSNAQCSNWFRRRPLSGAFDHPSKMVYPPGETYTPEATPDRGGPHDRVPSPWELKFKQWEHPDWEVSAKSESHYQNGPDTYLLQLRDTQFPVRLREYMKVACGRSPTFYLTNNEIYDPRTPIIHERRRFTDIMDEEIEDEQKERINNYGAESYTIRRLRHELGTRLDSYAEVEAIMEAKKDGQLPFMREKPLTLPIRETEPAQLTCYAVGDPKPTIQWFKNDMVIAEGQRIKIIEDEEGRSTLRFEPAMHHDIGFYKVVARNKVGQTVARCRIIEATFPDAPDSPTAEAVSDTEVLLRWKQPKNDGNASVVCYSLQYKEGDSVEWKDVATNIDHEFFVVRNLRPETSYQFRLSSRNKIGWSDKGIPTHYVKTKESGAPKLDISKAMKHLQQLTESGQEVVLDDEKPKLDYNTENNPIDWDTSQTFTEKYSFISELWRGKFSLVVKGVDRSNDNVVVAKILENRPETEVQIQREFDCLRRLKHERISNLLAAYQVPGQPIAALIMEKLQGADILTYLSSRHEYTEQMVATIVTQILDGLQYLHWRGYCHLDLQPDNVVMASVRSIQVKLIDFGSAHKVTKLGTSVPQVGDLEYKAPEIINDEPAFPQTDIWSVGVLTYIMLSGVSPFKGADDVETKQNISFVRYRFDHLYKEITQEATRFLMFIFKKVPQKRPSAEECHEHRWLAATDFIQRRRERAVFLGQRLKEFSDAYHERKATEASAADTAGAAFGSARRLARSNSVQEELLTTFAGH